MELGCSSVGIEDCSEGGVLTFFSDASSVSEDRLLVPTSLEVLIPILFVGLGPTWEGRKDGRGKAEGGKNV